MSQKISNRLLVDIIECANRDISLSLIDCAQNLGLKGATLSTWHRNFKSGKWLHGYNKTQDSEPLKEELVNDFKNSFVFSGSASKILRRLVTSKCLNNRSCFAKQHKILKRLFKKYPSVDFWLHVDFGDPRDDILLFTGNAEFQLKKKYMDFNAVDSYTPFEYRHTPPTTNATPPKPRKTMWDFFE
jgi:hypothetical protein